MPELFVILIKINIALVLFCLGYYLVLRKLTFYTLNRVYLITAIVLSSAYPFIDLSALAQRHQEIIAPVQNVVIIWQAPAENFVRQASYWNWLEVLFWAGAAIFALRLVFQLTSLLKIYRNSTEREINGQTVRVVSGDISPFSFWRSIYINPEKLSPTDLNNVLEHEQVHVSEWHTLDVLLTEISVIFYWFNPGIWMMKRAVRENIEFITDRKILQKGLDSKAYQYSLLNITFNNPAPTITSNFNFSTLKKRIKMMNAKRSSNLNLTRYAFLMPVVAICLFVFSLSKTKTVQASPAFKAVADAVEDLKSIAFEADTTPVTKKVTQTVTAKQDALTDKNIKIVVTSPDVILQTTAIKMSDTSGKNISLSVRGGNPSDSILIIVDGKVFSKGELKDMDPNQIANISVIKDASASEYINALGSTVKIQDSKPNGVIIVNTYRGGAATSTTGYKNINEVTVTGYGPDGRRLSNTKPEPNYAYDYSNRAPIVTNTMASSTDKQNLERFKDKLFIVDGKIIPANEIDKIKSAEVIEVSILNSKTAISLYGEKAKNGAVIVVTNKEQK